MYLCFYSYPSSITIHYFSNSVYIPFDITTQWYGIRFHLLVDHSNHAAGETAGSDMGKESNLFFVLLQQYFQDYEWAVKMLCGIFRNVFKNVWFFYVMYDYSPERYKSHCYLSPRNVFSAHLVTNKNILFQKRSS